MDWKFVITDVAQEAIAKQIQQRNPQPYGVRIGLRGGGCNGLSYIFEWTNMQPEETDIVFTFKGINVVIDKKSMPHLHNTELTFERGITNHGFKFNNPNVASSCSCAESVSF